MRSEPSTCTGLRAGVGQASGEETAARATWVVERAVAMAIADALPVSEHEMAASAVRAGTANADGQPHWPGNSDPDGGEDAHLAPVGAMPSGHRRTADIEECSSWSCGDPAGRRADGGIGGEQPHDQHRPATLPAHEGACMASFATELATQSATQSRVAPVPKALIFLVFGGERAFPTATPSAIPEICSQINSLHFGRRSLG